MRELDHKIRELLDKEAIKDVLARYAITVDSGDAEGFAELFTPDAVWEWPQVDLRYQGRGALHDLAAAIADNLPGGQHVMSNHVISVNGDSATVVCELTCFISRPQKIYTVLQGFYRDRLVKINGNWLICRRTVDVRNPELITHGEIGDLYSDLIAALNRENPS